MLRPAVLAVCVALSAALPARAQTATLTAAPASLNPTGGQVAFTFATSFTGGPAIFTCSVALPAGWVYLGGSGEPIVKPAANAQATAGNPLGWTDISALPSPVQFSFNASYPAGASVNAITVTSAVSLRQTVQVVVTDKTTGVQTTENRELRTDLAPAAVVFGTPPSISVQPLAATAVAGGTANFSVTAAGSGPLAYQWFKNGTVIAGATGRTLAFPNAQLTDAGNLTVVVTNPVGTVTSAAAAFTVTAANSGGGGGGFGGGGGGGGGGFGGGGAATPPTIAAAPASQSVATGGTASFTVDAAGTAPFTYQWQKNGAPISGATTATLTLTNVQSSDAGSYTVMIVNSAGSITTTAVTLTVTAAPPATAPAPPAISASPASTTAFVGASASFSVTAAGAATLTYQWRKNGVPLAGASSSVFSVASVQLSDAGNYSVIVTNGVGAVTSAAASLVVYAAGAAPTITASPPASLTALAGATVALGVTAGGPPPLTYQWRKNGANLPGATSATLTLPNVSAADAGAYTVVVANNSTFNTISQVTTLTVTTAAVPPVVTTQPRSQAATLGGSVTLGVSADGTAPFTYQWRKNGALLAGATGATLGLDDLRATDAGSYSVAVTNSAGTATSGTATLTLTPPTGAPAILTEPADLVARAGARATFTVNVSGTAPLTYAWRKNGATIASGSTLTLTNVSSADAAVYTVVIANALGVATSRAATLTIRGRSYAGTYFGSFGNGGSFALTVRDDNTGVFLGYEIVPPFLNDPVAGSVLGGTRTYVVRTVSVDDTGHFHFSAPAVAATSNGGSSSSSVGPQVAAAPIEYTFDGTISDSGSISATGPTSTLTATRAASTGAAANVAGFYQAGATGVSATTYSIVSPAGQAFVLSVTPTATVTGSGTIDAAGRISVATATNGTISGTLSVANSTLTASVTPTGGTKLDFTGGSDTRATTEKLINIATRGPVGGSAGSLIAGFVVTGDAPKQVLVRAIGPTLGVFGVGGALGAARLELFSGQSPIASSAAWGVASNAADIAAAAVRAGAFALDPASKDAVLLVTLEPGAYTAIVSGEGGAAGVALVEVYDVSENATNAQKVINIASRAFAGGGDSTLTAGFVISGTVPKRVLVRGAGPALTAFGLGGALADPQLKLFNQATSAVVATNDNWGDTADAGAISAAAGNVGAFAFGAGSKDAALLLNLNPGPYTVQLSGAGAATGTALIEIYEVP